jgi:hypothetical protein
MGITEFYSIHRLLAVAAVIFLVNVTTIDSFSPSGRKLSILSASTRVEERAKENTKLPRVNPPIKDKDYVDQFCRFTNEFFRGLTIAPVRDYLEMIPAKKQMTFFEKITTPPQYPGVPRGVSLTIAASVPTGLGWYGFYKFSVEEELFQDELRREGKVSGFGGYGTLLPFVFLFLIGTVTSVVPVVNAVSAPCFEAGGLWILLGQINLYRRVNELYADRFDGQEPLHAWWAVLPPPLDVVVGLRQVHFLAKYWASVREEDFPPDAVADEWFPFISSERFTLKEFVQQPKRWFWFTKEAKDLDLF